MPSSRMDQYSPKTVNETENLSSAMMMAATHAAANSNSNDHSTVASAGMNDNSNNDSNSNSNNNGAPTTNMIIHRVEPNDVLFGRGTGPNENPGNKVFRRLVLQYAAQYKCAATRSERRAIVRKALDAVSNRNARFLRKVSGKGKKAAEAIKKIKGKTSAHGPFELVNDPAVIRQKVKLALRYAGGDEKDDEDDLEGSGGADYHRLGHQHHQHQHQQSSSLLTVQQRLAMAVANANQHSLQPESSVSAIVGQQQQGPHKFKNFPVSTRCIQMSGLQQQQQQQLLQHQQRSLFELGSSPAALALPLAPAARKHTPPQHASSSLANYMPNVASSSSSAVLPSSLANMSNSEVVERLNALRRLDAQRRLDEQSAMVMLAEGALQQVQVQRAAFLESLIYDRQQQALAASRLALTPQVERGAGNSLTLAGGLTSSAHILAALNSIRQNNSSTGNGFYRTNNS